MRKLQIAQCLALGTTILTVLGIFIDSKYNAQMIAIGAILCIMAYILCGFGTAIKMSGRMAKAISAMFLFPFNIAALLVGFVFALIILFFFPIFPVRKAAKEKEKKSGE